MMVVLKSSLVRYSSLKREAQGCNLGFHSSKLFKFSARAHLLTIIVKKSKRHMSPSSAKKKKAPPRDDDDDVIITTTIDANEKPLTKKAKYPENPLGPPVPLQALKNDFFSHPLLPVWSKRDATFKGQKFIAVAFNVAGLRAMLKNKPECLRAVVDKTECDVLMFSEHKLNPENVDEATQQLKALLPEFSTVKFACSTAKKGYAGVCILARSACKETNDEKTKEGAKSPMK